MAEQKYILAIDTIEANTGIGLIRESKTKIVTWVSERNQSKELLPRIDRLLRAAKVKPERLKWVAVNLGPGSFTGLRIGLSIANAFGYALKIPVVGKSNLTGTVKERVKQLLTLKSKTTKFKPALPAYGRPPRITKPKPKTYC
ncbi:tRNA (adenosine(37)-N6)-threonylcarbamoyltransferase complex dimerization subunit type 1 TsaB [candidate division Kazan bacterium RIFCSPLOWO2_01_FULL_48_13]|uniref:tRNA (Adenosine(37)-N6)-threonylcarbamoyltransferase complex dimerization subunit type 1 TsaB n=1 Tax=candidate division Kazan bacterium RIFCSPLOWO2_01_FULL_48_13 TaxID=1798539 RepID=A0A1F4PMY0_UNCK3|nr:MAG: tRNA (adenosine(37)-N6)-threonylcarbamoyltransferase complex dimerization subunit type 1 TsaB [candidate division Kazan bacterium RIFCSPLOWO2_01_FULL_48_13]